MRQWLTLITISIALAQLSWAQLTIRWISQGANLSGQPADSRFPSISADGTRVVFQVGNGATAQIWQAVWDATNRRWQVNPVPIPQTDPPRPLIGIHPVISADGNHIAFASWWDDDHDGAVDEDPLDRQDNDGDGKIDEDPPKSQIYVLDRLQNRIVPISFLWQDTDRDGMRNAFVPSNGNCVPVAISADGRIVVFLAEWLPDDDLSVPNHAVPPDPATDPLSVDHAPQNQESRLYIVDENGDGRHEPLQIPPTNQPQKWLVLIHDRDADGNGVYDEAGIGATRTFVGSLDFVPSDPTNPFPVPAASISVSANGRIIAFMTTYNNDLDRQVDEDPPGDINGDGVLDDDGDGRDDEDPIDEQWRVIVRDWQSNAYVTIDNAFAPALSDDGTYLAYLQPTVALNEPSPTYLQSKMNLVVQRIERDPDTGRLTLGPSLSLTDLTLPAQSGTADGSAGWGYSDWWGAVTIAVDPNDANLAYVAFHAWVAELPRDNDGDGRVDEDPINGRDDDNDGLTDEDPPTDLIDLQRVHRNLFVSLDGMNSPDPLRVYQGVPNIFLARFNFAAGDVRMWLLLRPSPNWSWRGLPISLENGLDDDRDGRVDEDPVDGRDNDGDGQVDEDDEFRLPLAPSLLPAISFVNGNQLAIVFQSLMSWDKDKDGDGQVGEDPVDGRDNDGDGKIDEDPPDNGLWDIYLANVLLP